MPEDSPRIIRTPEEIDPEWLASALGTGPVASFHGEQIAGCSVEQARLAMRELARLHAPVFGDRVLAEAEWLSRPAPVNQALVSQLLLGFLERYGERIAAENRALCERFVAGLDAWL